MLTPLQIWFHSQAVIQAHDLTLYIQDIIVSGGAHCCKGVVFYEYICRMKHELMFCTLKIKETSDY
jgi:hypothetical protein